MKAIAKFLCLGVLAAAVVPAAKADSNNQIGFVGTDTYNTTTGAVTFLDANGSAPGNAYTLTSSGIFAPFANAAATFQNFNYLTSAASAMNPYTLITAVASPTLSAIFQVTSWTYTIDNSANCTQKPCLTVSGFGQYVVSNGTVIPNGNFTLQSNGGGGDTIQTVFNDTNSITNVTPEPNSLMLLGTGLVSTAGMLLRRRRAASVIA